jgi:hypothetical protein
LQIAQRIFLISTIKVYTLNKIDVIVNTVAFFFKTGFIFRRSKVLSKMDCSKIEEDNKNTIVESTMNNSLENIETENTSVNNKVKKKETNQVKFNFKKKKLS